MTTTEASSTDAPVETPPKCPKCGETQGVKRVPETSIWHHDTCGAMWEPDATAYIDDEGLHSADEVTKPEGDAPEVGAQVVPRDESGGIVDLPNLPLPGEWEQVLSMAVTFSRAGICPKALRQKPQDMALVLWTGRELGIPLTSAMREVYVIEGQTSISPKLKLGRVQMLNLGKIIPDPLTEQTTTSATALACLMERCQVCTQSSGWLVKDGEAKQCPACRTTGFKLAGPPHTFAWSDAIAAGLISEPREGRVPCQPGAHTCNYQSDGKTKYRCKDNWRHWPKNMHWWRASTQSVDVYFPQSSLGLYTPDDLGVVTDINGEIIDVDSIQVWTTQGAPGGGGGQAPAGPDETLATSLCIADLRFRVMNLPESVRTDFMERWTAKVDEGRLEPVKLLQARHAAMGIALVQGAEAIAKKELAWEPPPYPDDVVAYMAKVDADRAAASAAPQTPQAPADAPEGTQAPPDPREGVTAAQEPNQGQPAAATQAPGDEVVPTSADLSPVAPIGDVRTRALAAQIGQALPVLTDEVQDRAVAIIKEMGVRELNAELRKRTMTVEKVPENQRRYNLAKAFTAELADADWREANGVAE